jgi:hypothetical protein
VSEDIATRLLTWTHAVDAPPASDLMDEAAREIVELRNRLAELSVIVRTCRSRSECVKAAKRLAPVTVGQQLVNGFHRVELAWREMRQPTLTDEEREAIREAVGAYNDNDDDEECAKIAATLHGLLKRLG